MPQLVWNFDKEKIRAIFKNDASPKVRQTLSQYVLNEVLHANRRGVSKEKQKERYNLCYDAAIELARRCGWLKAHHKKERAIARQTVKQKKEEEIAREDAPRFVAREWKESDIIEISKQQWEKPGVRVAYFSYGSYRGDGWRKGLFALAARIIGEEGCHFPVFAGGMISKKWLLEEIERVSLNMKRKFAPIAEEHVVQETARALASLLPRFKKPDGGFARWYIMPSIPYDGLLGERVISHLQKIRSDIRQYKTGGERIEIRGSNGNPSIYHGIVLPKKRRLTSKYMSAAPEKDITDIEEQTSRQLPDLWVYGVAATALYKPSGEREIPYLTLPAVQKLEAEDRHLAENQSGLTIVEEMPDGDRLVHYWNMRDLIARERDFITGIKTGASETQKKIHEIIKREGARHPGRLADELRRIYEIDISDEAAFKEAMGLVEPKPSTRKAYPGFHYNEASQRFDFHQEWIQEMLSYGFPSQNEGWHENSFLMFGCLHAGYTTTDYEFVVKKFPEYILKYNIEVIAGIGDFIAGLRHDFMHAGEVLNMNYTEQESFAAELIATALFTVFMDRFEKRCADVKEKAIIPSVIRQLIKESLPLFLFIEGNHDEWQKKDGHTPLEKFYDKLISLLSRFITRHLIKKNIAIFDPTEVVEEKIKWLPVNEPVYELPSGIRVGLMHPHMARADTTSLRGEKALKLLKRKWRCQIAGIANFHVHVAGHKWWFDIGQCVFVQTATEVLYTNFELGKLKDTDFGPIMLKTFSHNGRIYKTALASFNRPMLEKPIPKDTNAYDLKKKLGLLGYE